MNCGRKGITLFKTDHAGFPDQDSSGKVRVIGYSCLLTQVIHWTDHCSPHHVINLYRCIPVQDVCVRDCHVIAHHPPTSCLQVTALLANSKATQRQSHASNASEPTRRKALASKKRNKAKKAHKQGRKGPGDAHQRQDSGAAHLGPVDAAPLDSSNIGSRMLVSMGWEAGTGLGSSLQGQVEPVPVIKRRKHLGLGA